MFNHSWETNPNKILTEEAIINASQNGRGPGARPDRSPEPNHNQGVPEQIKAVFSKHVNGSPEETQQEKRAFQAVLTSKPKEMQEGLGR